jgi:hypothetical protein
MRDGMQRGKQEREVVRLVLLNRLGDAIQRGEDPQAAWRVLSGRTLMESVIARTAGLDGGPKASEVAIWPAVRAFARAGCWAVTGERGRLAGIWTTWEADGRIEAGSVEEVAVSKGNGYRGDEEAGEFL